MELSAGSRRQGLVRVLLFLLLLGIVTTTVTALTPAPAQAQEAEQPKGKLSANPFVHFYESIGWTFGIIFAVISIGAVALIIVLVMDLRMGEAVPPAFIDDFTNMVNKRQFKQ